MNIDLRHGDCLEIMKTIPDNSIDCCLTDPPYGTTACKWDSIIPFVPMWVQLKRIMKDNGAICLFGSEPFSSRLRLSNIKMFKYDWVWEKSKCSNIFQAKYQPLKAHEVVSVFGMTACCYVKNNNNLNYYPVKINGIPYNKGKEHREQLEQYRDFGNKTAIKGHKRINMSGDRFPRSIQYFKTAESEGRFHPTQKPVPLLEYLIKTYTLEGETVLDFTCGSGSTGVACVNLNRKFIGIEKDDKYFQIATDRINAC